MSSALYQSNIHSLKLLHRGKVRDIYEAHGSKASSKILVIENLDDLKTRLAKVILMILIVTLFEEALKMNLKTALDLLYLGGAIALIGIALFFSHKAEVHGKDDEGASHKDNA